MNPRHLILKLLIASLALAMPLDGAAAVWEEVAQKPERTEHIDAEDVDIATHNGYLYITTSRPVPVKIFTILGQPVSQTTLPQGTHRLRIGAKGIYILKIGSVTRRLTI